MKFSMEWSEFAHNFELRLSFIFFVLSQHALLKFFTLNMNARNEEKSKKLCKESSLKIRN